MPSSFLTIASVLALVGVAACTAPLPHQEPTNSTKVATAPARTAPAASPSTSSAPQAPGAGNQVLENDTAVLRVLAYADRVRSLSPAELGPEFARLSDARSPGEQMQLALALAQLRQTPELIRAQDLLTRVLANASLDATALHPLARLLATRFGEQRRFEDLFDKQVQQTRDIQRRLDQTAERLEALKAIERSLGARAPAAPPPGNSTGTTNGNGSDKTTRPRSTP